MPRTNSRKRNSRRNDNTNRVSVASNLSPNAPEFVPMVNNDSSANQGEYSAVQSMTFSGSSNVPNSTGNYSNSNNSESSSTIVSTADPLENKGQRDLLINLLNTSQVDCVICYERTQNVEHIWNCRNCFQIMHLKCVMVWFIKSHNNAVWRCPACQNPLTGKPKYVCFCGALSNPFSNNVDTPHSCGQVCSLRKINTNADYDDCQHTCTLLCHPGPCPQCVVHVLRKCGCGKTSVYVQCGQSKPILCQNMCSKELECKNHICEKPCHVDKCGPCKMKCPQSIVLMESDSLIERPIAGTHEGRSVPIFEVLRREIMQVPNWRNPILNSAFVSAEELLVLGLNPDDYARERNQRRRYLTNDFYDDHESINFDDDEDDDDNEENLDGSARFYGNLLSDLQINGSYHVPSIIIPLNALNNQIANILASNITLHHGFGSDSDGNSDSDSTSSHASTISDDNDGSNRSNNAQEFESESDDSFIMASSSTEEEEESGSDNDSNSPMESEDSVASLSLNDGLMNNDGDISSSSSDDSSSSTRNRIYVYHSSSCSSPSSDSSGSSF